jgi:hypothetical protein
MRPSEPEDRTQKEQTTDMALLQDAPTLSAKRLMIIGIPAVLFAVAISLFTHREAHRIGDQAFCGGGQAPAAGPVFWLIDGESPPGTCGMSALAGQAWTFGLAVASFALFVRLPGSLFLMSMAFVNASARIPESATVFLQYLINNRTTLHVDETVALSLIGPADPAIPTVIMCFYSLLLLFFSIIVVHNVKAVRYKWAIALALFASMTFIERGILWAFGPLLGA